MTTTIPSDSMSFVSDIRRKLKLATPPPPKLEIKNLKVLGAIGDGTMASVLLVIEEEPIEEKSAGKKPTGVNSSDQELKKLAVVKSLEKPKKPVRISTIEPFALKVVKKKSKFIKCNYEQRAGWEITVISHLKHPFLPSLIGTLETVDLLAWAIPYYPGGNLKEVLECLKKPKDAKELKEVESEEVEVEEFPPKTEAESVEVEVEVEEPETELLPPKTEVEVEVEESETKLLPPKTEVEVKVEEPETEPTKPKEVKEQGAEFVPASVEKPKLKPNAVKEQGYVSTSVVKFYVAEILCALEHLHDMGLVYRDLKPENVLIQRTGHVALIDFEFSCAIKTNKSKKSTTTTTTQTTSCSSPLKACFTPCARRKWNYSSKTHARTFYGKESYIAPEIVRGDEYDFGVDWWALGVLAYEMKYAKQPFIEKDEKGQTDRQKTFTNVLTEAVKFPAQSNIDKNLTDLIKGLLDKDPTKRLGHKSGAQEIKDHDFFSGIRWDVLMETLVPPFLPADGVVGPPWPAVVISKPGLKDANEVIKTYFNKTKEDEKQCGSTS